MEAIRRNIDLLLFEQFLLEKFNPESFLEKARSVMQLVRRGATQGERDAGKMGMQRLLLRAKAEIDRMREEGSTRSEIDRFMNMLQDISSADKAEAPRSSSSSSHQSQSKQSIPKFKIGQWVICRDELGNDLRLGKIISVRANRFDNSYTYDVKMSDSLSSGTELYNEGLMRAATQEDLDAAAAKRPTPAKFKGGQFVIHTGDGSTREKMGRIAQDGEGWDRSTHSRWYQVEFLDGNRDLVEERFLRAATLEEIEAKLDMSKGRARNSSKKGTSDSSNTGNNSNDARNSNDIQAFARYVEPSERSDKVYGIVKRNGKFHTFWGGMHKALATKHYEDRSEAFAQYESKLRKGYKQTPPMGAVHTWLDNALNQRFSKLGESRRS